jgi:hypothetical protein
LECTLCQHRSGMICCRNCHLWWLESWNRMWQLAPIQQLESILVPASGYSDNSREMIEVDLNGSVTRSASSTKA